METLADKIKRDGALNELDAVGWAIRLAKRIELLHSRGISHGGISLASVRVDNVSRSSHGVLADAQPDAPSLPYHSPERVTAGGRSPSDDTWAVAVTLYAALTGQEPFTGGDEQEVRQKILAASVAPLAVFDVGDDELQRVLDEALARDKHKRTVKISALREALETWHPDPTTSDLPPLQEDEDFDDDEATMMRPAILAMPMMVGSKRASQPQLASGRDAKPPSAPAPPADSNEATSGPATHPSGSGVVNSPRPGPGSSASAPKPASVPRAAVVIGARSAPGAAAARAALPRLLARKPEDAAAKSSPRSPLPVSPVAPIIRELGAAAPPQAAAVPTTVRSSVVKVHEDDDDEATVMREGVRALADATRPKPQAGQAAAEPSVEAADAAAGVTDGESRITQPSPEVAVPAVQAAGTSSRAAAIDRSEATLLLPSDGPAESQLAAADTVPAPPASAASREVAQVAEALRAPAPVLGFGQVYPAAAGAVAGLSREPVAAGSAMAAAGAAPAHAHAQPAAAGPVAPAAAAAAVQLQPAAAGLVAPAAAAGAMQPPSQSYGQPTRAGYGPQAYPQPGVGGYGALPPSHPQPQPPASGFGPVPGPWGAPRESIPPPSRLLPAILVAVVVLIIAAAGAFALLRYRATGRVFGAARAPELPGASFRNT